MRKSEPIILYLPDWIISELDQALEQNPPNFRYQRIYFYYVIHHIVKLKLQSDEEYITLNMNLLKDITTSGISKYIKYLKKYEFIKSDESYIIGSKSFMYKLNDKNNSGTSKVEIRPDSEISKRILKRLNSNKTNYSRLQPHLKLMVDKLKKMEMDYEGAYNWINDNATDKQKLSYLTSINQIEDKRFRYFKRNITNKRLDTNLTNLKSDLRKFIKGNFVSIDLKNSQPFFLNILLDNIIHFNKETTPICSHSTLCWNIRGMSVLETFGIINIFNISKIRKKGRKGKNTNLSLFKKATEKGVLYDQFIANYEGKITRKELKNIMFKVLFSRNKYYKGYKKIIPYENDKKKFASVYPFVYEAIKILKEKDHRKLPIYLQKLESYLFIDCIARELVYNGIIPFTIHDSVIVEVEHQKRTIEIINKVFKDKIGVKPTFEVKRLK